MASIVPPSLPSILQISWIKRNPQESRFSLSSRYVKVARTCNTIVITRSIPKRINRRSERDSFLSPSLLDRRSLIFFSRSVASLAIRSLTGRKYSLFSIASVTWSTSSKILRITSCSILLSLFRYFSFFVFSFDECPDKGVTISSISFDQAAFDEETND